LGRAGSLRPDAHRQGHLLQTMKAAPIIATTQTRLSAKEMAGNRR
jgi:hypothetical protein